MVLGYPMTTVYMTVLIITGLLTLLYLILADAIDGALDSIPFFDLAVLLPLITITAALGYTLETFTSWQHTLLFILALIGASIATALLYYFLFVPLRKSDASLAYTDASLEGQIARVLTPIPVDGYGEILIEGVSGNISKRAQSYTNRDIPFEAIVIIIEMQDGVAYVAERDT